MAALVSRDCFALPAQIIALVDHHRLYCASQSAAGFAGHYVVLVGLDDERDAFLIKDPATSTERPCAVSARTFEAARKVEGTDEDLYAASTRRE